MERNRSCTFGASWRDLRFCFFGVVMGQIKKMCKTCGKKKLAEDFYVSKAEKDGLYYCCKNCTKEYYQKNKERVREYYQKNKERNKERNKEKIRAYYQKNKEKIREYYQKNREKNKEKIREYYQKNKERIIKACREYKRKNRDKTRKHLCLRYRNCIEFRIKTRLCGRINRALHGRSKSAHTRELIGCSVSELMTHLELMFKDGMSWKNYGEWHIDHIRPCASFDLLDPEQQRICFNWKNLQPLWAIDNIIKSDRYAA